MTTLKRFEDELASALRAAAPAIAPDRVHQPSARRHRRGHAFGWPAVAICTPAAIAIALVLAPERASVHPALASAATLLRQAASKAQAVSPVDGYAYTRWTFHSTVGTAERHTGTQEQWVDRRGRGERVMRGGGRPPSTTRLSGRLPFGQGVLDVTTLPRAASDQARLERLVDVNARHVVGLPLSQARAFVTYELLETALVADAPAPTRGALLRQLASAPGLRRAGSAVTLTIGAVRFTLIMRDTTVVGTERRLLRRSPQVPGPPRVLDAWHLVARGAVAHIGDRP